MCMYIYIYIYMYIYIYVCVCETYNHRTFGTLVLKTEFG